MSAPLADLIVELTPAEYRIIEKITEKQYDLVIYVCPGCGHKSFRAGACIQRRVKLAKKNYVEVD